jgi:hypothetical protein
MIDRQCRFTILDLFLSLTAGPAPGAVRLASGIRASRVSLVLIYPHTAVLRTIQDTSQWTRRCRVTLARVAGRARTFRFGPVGQRLVILIRDWGFGHWGPLFPFPARARCPAHAWAHRRAQRCSARTPRARRNKGPCQMLDAMVRASSPVATVRAFWSLLASEPFLPPPTACVCP